MPRSPNPVPQYFDAENKILAGGQMFYFESDTSTPKETYEDEAETIPNTHPVILDAAGRLPNVFFSGSAKQVLRAKPVPPLTEGALIWERDPVGSTVTIGDFIEWGENINYDELGEIVKYAGGFYISIQTPNQNQPPNTSPEYWAEVRFIEVWNPNIDYTIGTVVQTPSGNLWKAVAAQAGNDPEVDDGTNWISSFNEQWINKSAAFTIFTGKKYQIDASAGAVDAALKASYEIGDEIIVHNESTSTNAVRLTNTALTLNGPNGTITTIDNLVLDPGDTAHFAFKTTTIAEAV